MAAFSYQHHHPFLHLHSVFFPNTAIKSLSGFVEEGDYIYTNSISQFGTPNSLEKSATSDLDLRSYDDTSISPMVASLGDHELSSFVTRRPSTDYSTMVDKLETGEQVTQKLTPMDKKRKSKNGRDGRSNKQKKLCSNEVKEEDNKKPKAQKKDQKKKVPNQDPPTGYIHVRARRGQATDSHSLAERVRREKISERMKILQRLVPGCDKVTGKALMLEEIINYVQSLQNQVEFLSMKLASVNPLFYDFAMDLETLMIRPEVLSSLASSLPNMRECSQPTAFINTTATTPTATTPTITGATATSAIANNYPLIDTTAPLLLQGQRPSDSIQNNSLWEGDQQRQKFLNPSGFVNNLCSSFH